MFGSSVSFSRSADRMALFPVGANLRWRGRSLSWKFSNGHINATGHAIHFAFGSMVGFSDWRIESGWTKSKIAAVSRLVGSIR